MGCKLDYNEFHARYVCVMCCDVEGNSAGDRTKIIRIAVKVCDGVMVSSRGDGHD